MSRWLFPVPESPMRHSGSPRRIQSPGARACIVVGLCVEVEVPEPFLAGESGTVVAADRGPAVMVVALSQEEIGEEALVGEPASPLRSCSCPVYARRSDDPAAHIQGMSESGRTISPVGPDCAFDKHQECPGKGFDFVADRIIQCSCPCHGGGTR